MTEMNKEVFRALLIKLHERQDTVSGDEVPVFERLLEYDFAFYNGEKTGSGYTGVSPTSAGTVLALTGNIPSTKK